MTLKTKLFVSTLVLALIVCTGFESKLFAQVISGYSRDPNSVVLVDPTTRLPVNTTASGLKVDASGSVGIAGSVSIANENGVDFSSTSGGGGTLLRVDGSFVTQPISALSLPLPTGASTSLLQTSGNSSLSSIDSKVPSNLTVSATRLLVDASGTTQPVSGTVTANAGTGTFTVGQATGTNLHTVIDSGTISLPSGAATSANQTTANSSLSSIDSKVPANLTVSSTRLLVDPSGVTQPVRVTANVNGSISNNASVTTAASTFTAPANAVGFLLEAESSNTNNIRWAIGSTATASVGTLAEPGRDTGYIPGAADISVITIGGTQSVSVQWILSQ